jgi:hypothetical protein
MLNILSSLSFIQILSKLFDYHRLINNKIMPFIGNQFSFNNTN